MNYGDFTLDMDESKRAKALGKIQSHFRVTFDDIDRACKVADVEYPGFCVWSYYFIASCIAAGREIEDQSSDEEMDIETAEMVEEEAQMLIPIQNFVVWLVWVDLGYNAPDYGMIHDSGEKDDYIQIPQMSLYDTAERIMWSWVL
jgi:hypothetical protein